MAFHVHSMYRQFVVHKYFIVIITLGHLNNVFIGHFKLSILIDVVFTLVQ